MTLSTAIAHFRRRQADLFVDRATVYRVVAGGSLGVGNVFTPTTPTTIYSGVCLLRAFSWQGNDTHYGDNNIRLRELRAKFPVDTDVRYGDVVTPSASTFDESLIGVDFRVTDSFRDGWQIARVCILEEIVK